MNNCLKCGGSVRKTKTQVQRQLHGETLSFVDVPAYECIGCGDITLVRPQNIENLEKDESQWAVGISKLHYTNRYFFYILGLLSFACLALAIYLFLK